MQKKWLKIVIVSVSLLVSLSVGLFVIQLIQTHIDQQRFHTLDNDSKLLYQDLVKHAPSGDVWHYQASCQNIFAGDFTTGEYSCGTTINLSKPVTSVSQINTLFDTYYPIFADAPRLSATSQLDKQYPDSFGKLFVVSSAEQHFISTKTGIECRLTFSIHQSHETPTNSGYNSPIDNNLAVADLSLLCAQDTQSPWYKLTE